MIEATEPGIVTDAREVHPSNDQTPMDLTLLPRTSSSSPVQKLNAASPIEMTESGMVTDAREVHL